MQVIPPVAFTDAILTSSTVPEAVAATYAGGTTYALGDRAGPAPVAGAAQEVWESLQNSNTGNAQVEGAWWTFVGYVYPAYDAGTAYVVGDIASDLTNHLLYEKLTNGTGDALTDTTKWEELGPTNRWRMFGYDRSSATTNAGSIVVVFAPGVRTNSLAVSNIYANSYSMTVTSVLGGGTVYSSSGSLNTRETLTWYDYFFGEFTTQESLTFFDIPPYTDAIYTLTLTATSGNAECGAVVVGTYAYLGATQYQAVSDVLNFSSVARDADGNATLTRRRNIPKTSQTVWADKSRVNKIKQVREDLNGEPAFWFGIATAADGYFETLSILGVYKEFVINVSLPDKAIVNLTIEEV